MHVCLRCICKPPGRCWRHRFLTRALTGAAGTSSGHAGRAGTWCRRGTRARTARSWRWWSRTASGLARSAPRKRWCATGRRSARSGTRRSAGSIGHGTGPGPGGSGAHSAQWMPWRRRRRRRRPGPPAPGPAPVQMASFRSPCTSEAQAGQRQCSRLVGNGAAPLAGRAAALSLLLPWSLRVGRSHAMRCWVPVWDRRAACPWALPSSTPVQVGA